MPLPPTYTGRGGGVEGGGGGGGGGTLGGKFGGPKSGGEVERTSTKMRASKTRRPPSGFGEGDEGYGSFARSSASIAVEEYGKKRATFVTETRDAQRERIVKARELKEYREAALNPNCRKEFSDWLAGGVKRASSEGNSDNTARTTRPVADESIVPKATSAVADDAEDIFDQIVSGRESPPVQEGATKRRHERSGSGERVERSWARKALQSALAETKKFKHHVQWFH